MFRAALLIGLVSATTGAHAQQRMAGPKRLIAMLGGGLAPRTFTLPAKGLDQARDLGAAVDLAFHYGLSDRWSLGFHYAWLGGELPRPGFVVARVTCYHLEGSYRFMNTGQLAWEGFVGLGMSLAALRTSDARLPLEARWGSWLLGTRVQRLLGNVVGVHGSLACWPMGSGPISQGGDAVTDTTGTPLTLQWTGASLTLGIFTRF